MTATTDHQSPPAAPATAVYRHALAHPRDTAHVPLAFGFEPARWTPAKVEHCERLIRAYRASIAQAGNPLKTITDADLWTGITAGHFAELLKLVAAGDADGMSRYLNAFGSDYVWFGGVTTGIDGYNHWDRDEQAIAYSYFDKLVCLAEAIGALPAENPEQGAGGNWGRNIALAPDAVADAVRRRVGVDLMPPPGTIPVAGLRLAGGLLHYRHINSLYVATRVRDLTEPGDAVCEFGGGLGLVAYFLYRMGRPDTTLYDIPITNLLSGFFLLSALGGDAVTLEGEPPRAGTIRIRANWNCSEAADGAFRLALNVDSFPEINRRIFDEYVAQIRRTVTGRFLSINHEVEHPISGGARHLNVSALLAAEPGWRRVYRAPYWLRRGYVEELYALGGAGLPVPAAAVAARSVAATARPEPAPVPSKPASARSEPVAATAVLPTLQALYAAHRGKVSDKWTLYFPTYDAALAPYRHRPVRLLEIGIQNGGSLEIWSRYFADAAWLVGCDINPACTALRYEDRRIRLFVADANRDETRQAILAISREWDIVIDDGSHRSRDIVLTFLGYFSHVAPGGVFIAEDLHCSYWQPWDGGLFDPYSSITFFKLLVDLINHQHWGVARPRADLLRGFAERYGGALDEAQLAQIHSIEFVNSVCIVRKRAAAENLLGTRFVAGTEAAVVPSIAGTHGSAPLVYDQSRNPWTARAQPPAEELVTRLMELFEARAALQTAGPAPTMPPVDG
ncbi:MAG: class I SAM-dependent methyltransferase [Lautropia sp.]